MTETVTLLQHVMLLHPEIWSACQNLTAWTCKTQSAAQPGLYQVHVISISIDTCHIYQYWQDLSLLNRHCKEVWESFTEEPPFGLNRYCWHWLGVIELMAPTYGESFFLRSSHRANCSGGIKKQYVHVVPWGLPHMEATNLDWGSPENTRSKAVLPDCDCRWLTGLYYNSKSSSFVSANLQLATVPWPQSCCTMLVPWDGSVFSDGLYSDLLPLTVSWTKLILVALLAVHAESCSVEWAAHVLLTW